MNNRFNKVFPAFNPLNPEFKPGNRIIDSFSEHFSFHLFNKSNNYLFKNYIQQLNNLAIESSNTLSNILMVIDASVKNNATLSIAHIHVHNRPVVKTLHHVVNITSTEAKFFAIRYSINQAAHLQDVSKIIVVTDSIYIAKMIFDPSLHMLQKQAALILNDLRNFFNCHHENTIEFWKCPSKSNWKFYKNINIKTKSFNLTYHIPNSKTCPKHVWLQHNIKFPQLFGLICDQNSIGSLILYNRLNPTKSLWLFRLIWVKICSHIHLCPLPNYLPKDVAGWSPALFEYLLVFFFIFPFFLFFKFIKRFCHMTKVLNKVLVEICKP